MAFRAAQLLPPLLLGAAASLPGALAQERGALPKPPPATGKGSNVVFLMCDSMDGRVLDPTSPVSRRVSMPNLRKLGSRGVNFVRSYAASPQCVPSRTSMFAGRRTDQIRAWNNGQGLAGVPGPAARVDKVCARFYGEKMCHKFRRQQNVSFTLVDALRQVGTEPHIFGKVDVGAGILQDSGAANGTATGFHTGPALDILTRTADIRRATKSDPLEITNTHDNHVHGEDWRMLPKCVEFLRNAAASAPGAKAWMLYCSLNIPHPPFDTNATWLARVNDSALDVPAWPERAEFHPADSYMSLSKNVWKDFSREEILKVRRTYYAMCAETDFMLGTVIDALHSYGLAEQTWVVFVSDHGEMNMEHRQIWKNSMYEASSRVPFIISPPPAMKGVRRGAVVTNLTSLLDVLPTLVEIAQTDIGAERGGPAHRGPPAAWQPDGLAGYSLVPFLWADPDAAAARAGYPTNRSVTSQYHSNMGNTGSFMLRSGPWKYIAFGRSAYDPSYAPQLFDVSQDPEELHDVALSRPQVARALDAELRSIIPYEEVDREAMQNDFQLYKRYFSNRMTRARLRSALERQYKGFDDTDFSKIDEWVLNNTHGFFRPDNFQIDVVV